MPVFCVSDTELVHTAGLDALIFHRACAFGVIFFLPVTVLASAVCARPPAVTASNPSWGGPAYNAISIRVATA